ncbi:Malonyl CoA-acyl carrier protein transacylase [Symmachiella macrocystis]|uniref:Malonyl CoA-acyl carrier protein transacylase n=1 Tax=Symmachiella macrocystis TaxID=2527985 RepID=A0A5C6BSA6_9PLAN|nr:acyltransferase domain-containing protein [Symmachiella macrocystis]TWU13769.1 Malonyl CoA-acyl carrier protein transacylase [Symmachiella macrocystis]
MSVGVRKTIDETAETVKAHSTADPVAWLFPGLGSRFVGMGADIIGKSPAADKLITLAAQKLGYDIHEVCFSGSGRKFVPPRIEAQVIYVINCAYVDVLRSLGRQPQFVCGHSLGSWAAAYAAGAIDFESGLEMVTAVEDLLEQRIPDGEQAMGVIIGLDEETVTRICADEQYVYLANSNSPKQFVIAGRAVGVDAALEKAGEQAAKKTQRIAGSRAMHTPLLADVNRELQTALARITIDDPTIPQMNCDTASPMHTAVDVRRYLGQFLQRPVRWEATMHALGDLSITQFVEVGAAAVLTGMMPFIDPSAKIETVSDLLARDETANAIDPTTPVLTDR